jgi:RNA polymerase sigma-70 factor (ECF subfamily)
MALEDAADGELFKLALAGEESAFVSLYRRWQGNIYRFSLRISGSASAAEDITQEVFLSLMDSTSRFNPTLGSFSSYVYGIARNHLLRRMSRERIFAPIAENSEEENQVSHEDLSRPSDPLSDIAQQEMKESLHRAIATLPLRYREVVVLCELEELKYGEAARVIGCPEGTIRSRLHRARTLLLHKLHEKKLKDSRTAGIAPAGCTHELSNF